MDCQAGRLNSGTPEAIPTYSLLGKSWKLHRFLWHAAPKAQSPKAPVGHWPNAQGKAADRGLGLGVAPATLQHPHPWSHAMIPGFYRGYPEGIRTC